MVDPQSLLTKNMGCIGQDFHYLQLSFYNMTCIQIFHIPEELSSWSESATSPFNSRSSSSESATSTGRSPRLLAWKASPPWRSSSLTICMRIAGGGIKPTLNIFPTDSRCVSYVFMPAAGRVMERCVVIQTLRVHLSTSCYQHFSHIVVAKITSFMKRGPTCSKHQTS